MSPVFVCLVRSQNVVTDICTPALPLLSCSRDDGIPMLDDLDPFFAASATGGGGSSYARPIPGGHFTGDDHGKRNWHDGSYGSPRNVGYGSYGRRDASMVDDGPVIRRGLPTRHDHL